MRFGQVGRQRLLTQDILPGSGGLTNRARMKLVGSGNEDGVDILALEHGSEAAERVIDFEFGRNLAGAAGGCVGHRDEASFRHKSPDVFGMALAHFSNAEHADSELVHLSFSPGYLAE